MASSLVLIVFTLNLIFTMSAAISDIQPFYCAGLPPIEGNFHEFDGTCYIQRMQVVETDKILTSCATFTIDKNREKFSGTSMLKGKDTNGNLKKVKFSWREVDDDFVPVLYCNGNPLAQVRAFQSPAPAPAKLQSIIHSDKYGYIMVTCSFPKYETPQQVEEIIICTGKQDIQPDRLLKLLFEAERRGINTKRMLIVDQEDCD